MPSGVPSILALISSGGESPVSSTLALKLKRKYATRVSRTALKWVASIALRSRTPSMQEAKNGASLSALKTASRGAATVISPAKFKITDFLDQPRLDDPAGMLV